jgi:thiosulfate/3-mercaptopyruvate sulfurtransferase
MQRPGGIVKTVRLPHNGPMHSTLISAPELQHLMDSGTPLRIYDCSFDLMDPQAGRAQYETRHIAGAVHADLDIHLSDKASPDRASGGRHPLPSRERLAGWLGRTGLTPGAQVVVYDRQGANYCGRLWWMLKWCGHEAVAVLDGGLQAWLETGGATDSGPGPALPDEATPYPLSPARVGTATTGEIAARIGDAGLTLIDARANARFRGEVEPLDPVAGHIPGALNRPFSENLGPDGRFKPAEQLRAEFRALLGQRDPATVVHHCGSGVSAIPNLLAMEVAGLGTARLYPGSWSEWCNTPGVPCARSQVPA